MISGAPKEARRADIEQLIRTAFPRHRLLDIQPLAGGFRNTNLKLSLDADPHHVVLRIYEHDPALCQKEIDLLRLVSGSVPVPEIIHAAPEGRPFILMNYVEGISFRELRRRGDAEALAQAAFSAGETLAAIGRHTFSKSGWIAAGRTVAAPLLEGADPMPRFVDLCLGSEKLQQRVDPDLRERVHQLVWAEAAGLAALDTETHLVHGDFNERNLLVREVSGRWAVAAVLDWEFAVSSTPLADIGNFLRCGEEPQFSAGFQNAGGTLPLDWRHLARVVDLTAVCEVLTRDHLPDEAAGELIEILRHRSGIK